MLLSAIKENDNNETRVSISPESVKLFSRLGFEVIIENGAGETSGYQNSNYEEAGAKITDTQSDPISFEPSRVRDIKRRQLVCAGSNELHSAILTAMK